MQDLSSTYIFSAIKKFIPSFIKRFLRRCIFFNSGGISLKGPFPTWEEASLASSGYDSSLILDKVLSASLKVKNGEAIYERDSVIFDQINILGQLQLG